MSPGNEKAVHKNSNGIVQINTNWLHMLYLTLTMAALVISGIWWLSGVRAESAVTTYELRVSSAEPTAKVKLFVKENTLSSEDFREFRGALDIRLDWLETLITQKGN